MNVNAYTPDIKPVGREGSKAAASSNCTEVSVPVFVNTGSARKSGSQLKLNKATADNNP